MPKTEDFGIRHSPFSIDTQAAPLQQPARAGFSLISRHPASTLI
jgi:hypothetical protein